MNETDLGDTLETLDEAGVLLDAERATGLSDWGTDDTFRIGLRIFIEALDDMNAPPELRAMARGHIQQILSDRLHWVADETAHPEILDIPIERPVIVVGMPRTGTTILYDLLACDPASRAPRYWETGQITPAPEIATWETDPRIAASQEGIDTLLSIAPEVSDFLPLGATLPAECNRFMPHHFYGTEVGSFYGVPLHSQWVAAGTAPGLYKTHRRILQQLAWKGPRGRWTLKSPVHQFNLSDLVDEYPDACLVWTHRDPMKSLASLVDLLLAVQKVSGGSRGREEIAAEVFDVYGAALVRGFASRSDPRIEARILDIPFRDTAADPIAVVRRVHDHFDLPFTPQHRDAISAFITAHPKGDHRYRPEDCGYSQAMFESRFADYYARFRDLF